MNSIIKRPVISEKSLKLAANGWYTFAVRRDSSKEDIKKEISRLYKVTVLNVHTASMHGKERRVGRKLKRVQKPDWKKALVELSKGQTIDVFEVSPEEGKK